MMLVHLSMTLVAEALRSRPWLTAKLGLASPFNSRDAFVGFTAST